MIQRDTYLQKLISFRDTQVIKVITGIRRCGKSTIFELYKKHLIETGIQAEQIIHINFEDLFFEPLLDYHKLYNFIVEKLTTTKTYYIFLDEIQMVPQYQKVVNSLQLKSNIDIYITGSNAYLLSGELATLLSGRYVEIKMYPLSFAEYVSTFPTKTDISKKYTYYLLNSSFPGAIELQPRNKIQEYLSGIYHTIVMKDVVARLKISDIFILESLIKYIFDNIGNLTSTKKIADTMTNDGRSISVHTVERYLSSLVDSYIIYRVPRFDIKGKQLLRTGDKYYIADIGLRYFLLGNRQADSGHILENVIYLELLRRYQNVYVGKSDNAEVDFITNDANGTQYFQIALTTREEATLQRELTPLNNINDHNPKYLLTLDDDPPIDYNGIKKINALDWLLDS